MTRSDPQMFLCPQKSTDKLVQVSSLSHYKYVCGVKDQKVLMAVSKGLTQDIGEILNCPNILEDIEVTERRNKEIKHDNNLEIILTIVVSFCQSTYNSHQR